MYETFKVGHCYLLMKAFSQEAYGAVGSIFSFIYLMTYIADLGATNSLPAYIQQITKSRQTLYRFLTHYTLAPHLPIIILSALAATYYAATNLPLKPTLILIPTIIVFEAVRSFLRMLLHTLFKSQAIVTIELTIFFAYLAATWIPVFGFGMPLTLNYIFLLHLIDSLASVALLSLLTIKAAAALPNGADGTHKKTSKLQTIMKSRLFNYLLRVSRNFFTSNFLTPLFAARFGLTSAGIFYFASMFANSIQAIVKSAIGYSGNALLGNIKDADHQTKCEAFSILASRLLGILAPPIFLIATNANHLVRLGSSTQITNQTIGLTLLFILISFTEFFFILYEQFYVIEEAAHKLFFIKIIELAIFYSFITSQITQSPIHMLAWLIVIRMVSFIIIATNAWFTWRIIMRPRGVRSYVIISILLGLSINAALAFFNI